MATADLEFNMKITGTPREIEALLEIMFEYDEGKDGVYFSSVTVNAGGETFWLRQSGKEEILSAVRDSGEAVGINACGPFGRYGELDDVEIFREMAQAAPGAGFTASISGFAGYADQSLEAALADGLLRVSSSYLSDDVRGDAELEYFSGCLPYENFLELFRIDGEEFDEDIYEDFISDNFCGYDSIAEFFEETEYEEFIAMLDAECPLSEEEYSRAVQQLAEMECESYDDYLEREGFSICEEYTYDPVEKKYIDVDRPRMKAGEVCSINDDIREYLQSIGHSSDDETIAALSVDDVYSILAGTYGKPASTEDDSDEPGEVEETADVAEAEDEEIVETADASEADEDGENVDTAEEPAETESKTPVPKKSAPAWLIVLLIVIVLAALAAVAFVFGEQISDFVENLLSIAGLRS